MTPDDDAIRKRLTKLRQRTIFSDVNDANEQRYIKLELIDIVTDIQEQEK